MKYNKRKSGRFISNRRFKLNDLQKALDGYKPRKDINGCNNPQFKHGFGEQYVRIRVNGLKVKRSHIVWMLHNKVNKIPNDKIIHHINGNKRDDRIENLELVNHIEHAIMNI